MECYGLTAESTPFIDRNNEDRVRKYGFQVSNNDDYNTDVVEFRRGVDILGELAENGIITEEEENRRRILLKQYLDYQRNDRDELSDLYCCRVGQICFAYVHRCWDRALQFAYYTETD